MPNLLAIFPAPLRDLELRKTALLGRRQLVDLGGGDVSVTAFSAVRFTSGASTKR